MNLPKLIGYGVYRPEHKGNRQYMTCPVSEADDRGKYEKIWYFKDGETMDSAKAKAYEFSQRLHD